ncbi:MAG TPA: UvrD-helicase domain-containing protein, partial [Jatrophihabitans sp.]|nr:UvrD-helicase domain-containing protein [Jatrophihabitans sp.]
VLGLTFTRKAAGELQHRIRRRLRGLYAMLGPARTSRGELPYDTAGEPTVLTYAAYAGRLVDEHGIVLGREPGARLLTEAARWQAADSVVRNYTGTFAEMPGVIATVTERVLDLAGQLADHLAGPDQIRELGQRLRAELEPLPLKPRARTREWPAIVQKLLESLVKREDLLPLVAAFAERKQSEGLLDFADHMVLACQLAAQPPVAAIERSRFDVVLLDEYQDTGYAQVEMLAGLFADGRAVTAVGDPLQSIYSWRGASAGNIGRFADRFRTRSGAPATVYPLMTSWRNDQRILAAANQLAEPLRQAGERPLAERPEATPGLVVASYTETVRSEADWLASRLHAEWHDRTDWTRGQRTLAVLVRKRSGIGLIAQTLRQAGLPVEVVDLGGLLSLPEVADVRAMLTVLTDHNAGGSLARLLTGARWRIGAADLVALHQHARLQARRTGETITRHGRGTEPAAAPAAAAASASASEPGHAPAPEASSSAPSSPAAGGIADPSAEPEDTPDERIEPSLIEALDDLCDQTEHRVGRFSEAGYRRLRECGLLLRRLRRRLELSLPELIAEIEVELGLDAEVAARPGTGYAAVAGRANLDRFADEAARFMADRSGASISAFLGYLKAAENEEYGLKPATVDVTPERVQILTVHGAKGLEWDVVAVAGLVTDTFPDQAKKHDWTTSPALLPSPLRGDADQLPRLDFAGCRHRGDAEDRLTSHHEQLKHRHLREERRLAYVAFTRARKVLIASGAAWGNGSAARAPSVFLTELRDNPAVLVDGWHDVEPDERNPLEDQQTGLSWPFDPLGERRPAMDQAAARVLAELQRLQTEPVPASDGAEPGIRTGTERTDEFPPAAERKAETEPEGETEPEAEPEPEAESEAETVPAAEAPPGPVVEPPNDLASLWTADVELLLAERAAANEPEHIEVPLPERLTVSDVVTLTGDPQALARRLRRPLPQQPARQARRGTSFHEWLEQRWAAESLLDIEDLPGAADELTDAAELAELKQAFERSPWADRTPIAVEVGFEMSLGGRVIRGRMDAVFAEPDGGYTVVDWKTGRPPTGRRAEVQAVQLALYRLAWAALRGLPDSEIGRVGAAFHYVGAGVTVSPANLLDADQLRQLINSDRGIPAAAGTD